jgi:adenine-specific DNA-methyltransferase
MPMPPIETIRQIGNAIIIKNNFTQSAVDEIVAQYFELQKKVNFAYD